MRRIFGQLFNTIRGPIWAEQLQRKIDYIVLAERSEPIQEYEAFLGVVAALPIPELSALLDVPWKWERRLLPSDASQYFKGSMRRNGREEAVIAVATPAWE